MANYHYDESGNMAAYFIITFLAIALVPLTLSSLGGGSNKNHSIDGCQCKPCTDQRASIRSRERRSILKPQLTAKGTFIILGWALFGYLTYKTANAKIDNKIYDPFEILGLATSVTEKEIKSHFKKLSKIYHPDKVKVAGNDTLESIQNKFVEITKAYKSLTDETIRRNWEEYGNPDGRTEAPSMGIALPQWIIEGKNNIWVLGLYGLVFGGVLPLLVGNWWFGSQQRTKDGVNTRTASAFFKSLNDESTMKDVVAAVGKSYAWETRGAKSAEKEVQQLESTVNSTMGKEWKDILSLAEVSKGNEGYESRKRALVLLYSHFLRLTITSDALKREQSHLLLQTPVLLNALLTIATSRNWLAPTLSVMRLHAYLAQAILPGQEQLKFAQLPNIKPAESPASITTVDQFVESLDKNGDGRVADAKLALQSWGRLDLVDATFKVIGERIVIPSSIVFLVVKLRVSPRGGFSARSQEKDVNETKRIIKVNEERDQQFLISKKEVEELPNAAGSSGLAHAPYWPGYRKPSWWLVIADDKSNRIVVPPMKISDVPSSKPELDGDYRQYKIQFQAPGGVGLFTWKIYLVSDTFVGDEICQDIALKIDDATALNADEQAAEDEISDPEEDSLAGQMAAMRGGSVKKAQQDEESDEESGTDDDQDDGSSSDSDSD
ncbi:hypothetical protein HWV62_28248 [Athelia sp. TMB]|nr:hypothetical protein HWV62_28248 [Athelia sp. TMB]